jgi:hypothetical protein
MFIQNVDHHRLPLAEDLPCAVERGQVIEPRLRVAQRYAGVRGSWRSSSYSGGRAGPPELAGSACDPHRVVLIADALVRRVEDRPDRLGIRAK